MEKTKKLIKFLFVANVLIQIGAYFYLDSTKKFDDYLEGIFLYGIQVVFILPLVYLAAFKLENWRDAILRAIIILVFFVYASKPISVSYLFLILLSIFPMD